MAPYLSSEEKYHLACHPWRAANLCSKIQMQEKVKRKEGRKINPCQVVSVQRLEYKTGEMSKQSLSRRKNKKQK